MNIDIYYFSGTGNSLHVAKQLQQGLPNSDLIPVVNALKSEDFKAKAEMVGFVFPLFCLTIPIPLKEFLEKLDLSSAEYLFAACTRGGSESQAEEDMNRILKNQGKKLNAFQIVNMCWNHPLGKDNLPATATKEEIDRLEGIIQPKLDSFAKVVCNKEDYHVEDTEIVLKLPKYAKIMALLIPPSLNNKMHSYMYQKKILFYADSNCSGCGICEKICLSNRIQMDDNHPYWEEEIKCFGCFACINYCPQQAIQIRSKFPVKSYTEVNDRYHHPEISFKEVAAQK